MIKLLAILTLLWGAWAQTEPPTDEIVVAVCGEDNVLPDGEGCATCPAMTSFAGQDEPFRLSNVYTGSFSDVGLDEFLASFSGCEPRAIGNSTVRLAPDPMPDGSFPLVQEMYYPGVSTTNCTVARITVAGAVDELFCEVGFVGQGIVDQSLVNYDFSVEDSNPFAYTMARGIDFRSFGCLNSSTLETRYTVSYPDANSVDVVLVREEVAYPSPDCERVVLGETETLSYSWRYSGSMWAVFPLYYDLNISGVLTLEQYQEAERQIQEGDIDDTLAAYLAGRLNAEQFAALF